MSEINERTIFAAMMVNEMMQMDWLLAYQSYSSVVKPMLQLIDKAGGASMYYKHDDDDLAWSYVFVRFINIDPSADDLAKIAI
jgi:malate dehydrogenase (oxaloacetate-decarboxylating)(NADP+)